jgi:hypothetical protein
MVEIVGTLDAGISVYAKIVIQSKAVKLMVNGFVT